MLNSATISSPLTSSCNPPEPINPFSFTSFHDFLVTYRKERSPKEMVVVFAHGHLFKDSPRHVLCVRKKPGSRHAGLLNLPGGILECDRSSSSTGNLELPHIAALRELKEETNLDASQPQLVGCIVNGPMDAANSAPPFLVHVVRCIINPGQADNVVAETDQPVSWELINHLSTRKFVTNLRFFIPLIAADLIGFVVQDSDWEQIAYEAPISGNHCNRSQAILTFLPLSIPETTPSQKPRRIET